MIIIVLVYADRKKNEMYYKETVIKNKEFGIYTPSQYNDKRWEESEDLLVEMYDDDNQIYILGEDELPYRGIVEDIRGRIYDEPEIVFAVVSKDEVLSYGGIKMFLE